MTRCTTTHSSHIGRYHEDTKLYVCTVYIYSILYTVLAHRDHSRLDVGSSKNSKLSLPLQLASNTAICPISPWNTQTHTHVHTAPFDSLNYAIRIDGGGLTKLTNNCDCWWFNRSHYNFRGGFLSRILYSILTSSWSTMFHAYTNYQIVPNKHFLHNFLTVNSTE